jgi:uncharacterized protein (TIGR04255 family)
MARIRHLNRAPIAEAVIELRVRSASSSGLDSLAALSSNWRAQYPLEQKVEAVAATFGVQDGRPKADAQYQQLGFMLKTSNQHEVVQFRHDAFAFSQLQPYSSWEEVLPKANELWISYRDVIKPDRLVRLGVRYINRLRLPLPVDLSEFLESPPVGPRMLASTIRTFLTRVVLHDVATGNSVIVTQASEPSTHPDQTVILLDVDAFRDVDLPTNDEDVVAILESLRLLKNQAFFGSITERTAEMYE